MLYIFKIKNFIIKFNITLTGPAINEKLIEKYINFIYNRWIDLVFFLVL